MQQIDKIAWLYIKNKKVLGARSKGIDVYYIPGGKRNGEEKDQEALIREIKEELSIDILPNTIQYVKTFKSQAHNKPQGTMVQLTCYFAEFTGEIKASSEIEEIKFLGYEEKEKFSPTARIIMEWLKSENKI